MLCLLTSVEILDLKSHLYVLFKEGLYLELATPKKKKKPAVKDFSLYLETRGL